VKSIREKISADILKESRRPPLISEENVPGRQLPRVLQQPMPLENVKTPQYAFDAASCLTEWAEDDVSKEDTFAETPTPGIDERLSLNMQQKDPRCSERL
jgi:hypothetical protein